MVWVEATAEMVSVAVRLPFAVWGNEVIPGDLYGCMDGCMYVWMDGWMDVWMDG